MSYNACVGIYYAKARFKKNEFLRADRRT